MQQAAKGRRTAFSSPGATKETAMKTLIVYYSYTQGNESIARELQEQLGADILKVEEIESRNSLTIFLDNLFNRKPRGKENKIPQAVYDSFIFVGPIWAGKIASPFKSFIIQKTI